MCKAFSGVITKSQKVYWKTGVDSHEDIIKLFKGEDLNKELQDNREPPHNLFARFEISPHNENYLNPDKWVFKIDEQIQPEWWFKSMETPCQKAFKKWKKEVYSFVNLKEARNSINPIKIKHSDKVSKEELDMLKNWASVRANIGASIWDSVGNSVRDSVRDSVWASVRDSVGAYIGSLFLGIDKWKNTEKIKTKGYPFQPCVDLWKRGLVPSYDGKIWRIHLMNKKAKVIWEGKI